MLSTHVPVLDNSTYTVFISPESVQANAVYGYTNSDWANDSSTRKSVSGTAIFLADGSVVYKIILQQTITLSPTEVEIYVLTEIGKLVIYVRMVLSDLEIEQSNTTVICEDNGRCLQMNHALKSIKRIRHVETKYFAILHWVQTNQLGSKKIDTSVNASGVLTKITGRDPFYNHNATIMGK